MSPSQINSYTYGWEAEPWFSLFIKKTLKQWTNFIERAAWPIQWQLISYDEFPADGLFGHNKDWFRTRNIVCFAFYKDEFLLLIQHDWFGWPDPPEWGLAFRKNGLAEAPFIRAGNFDYLPSRWLIPDKVRNGAEPAADSHLVGT